MPVNKPGQNAWAVLPGKRYIHLCIYHIYVCMYTCIHMYVCTYVRTYVCMYACMHVACVHACVHAWICVCVQSLEVRNKVGGNQPFDSMPRTAPLSSHIPDGLGHCLGHWPSPAVSQQPPKHSAIPTSGRWVLTEAFQGARHCVTVQHLRRDKQKLQCFSSPRTGQAPMI